MLNPNTLVIYVDDIPSLTHFYQNLLGKKPAESSPTFTMFHLDNLVLGLKARNTAIPPVNGKQGFELASIIDSKAKLDALHIEWQQKRGKNCA